MHEQLLKEKEDQLRRAVITVRADLLQIEIHNKKLREFVRIIGMRLDVVESLHAEIVKLLISERG